MKRREVPRDRLLPGRFAAGDRRPTAPAALARFVCASAVAAGLVVMLGHRAHASERLYLPAVLTAPRVAPVTAGVPHGLQDGPFLLELRTETPGALIRFTADGSLPSAANGIAYDGPVPIVQSTVIRATAVRAGFLDAPVTTRTYIIVDDVLRQSDNSAKQRGFPTTWGKYGDDWVLSGSYVPARYSLHPDIVSRHDEALRAALRALPSMSVAAPMSDVFGPEGIYANPMVEGDERAASLELLASGGEPGFQIDCGLRIAGGYSRRPDVVAKHSFSVRFRSRYGAGRLRYPLFAGSPVTSFDVLRLRASQADSFYFFADRAQYLHDQWARDTQRAMGTPSARGRYVHLFVNGLYWGIYNVTEEPTAAFASDYLGGDDEDWDVIKDGDAVDGRWQPEVEDGSMDAYRQMLDIVERIPHPDPSRPADREAFDRLAGLLDLQQHGDYTLLQIFGANFDWPDKNWRAARSSTGGDRFRFFVWDFEHTTALRDDPARGFCLPRRDPSTHECGFNADTEGVGGIHGWLRAFPDYRSLFADRVQVHLIDEGGALRPDASGERYAALAAHLAPAIVAEAARWGTGVPEPMTEVVQAPTWRDYRRRHGRVPQSPTMWLDERERLLESYYPQRTRQVLEQLCREGLYPPVLTPVIQAVAGGARAGARVSMRPGPIGCPGAVAAGTIYYTRDGSDPRGAGGAVAPSARPYVGALKIDGFARVSARLLAPTARGPEWSALARADFGSPRLGISEIMYHPAGDADAEFLELVNLEPSTADFSGYSVGIGVTFTLRTGTILAPGGHLVLVRDEASFEARYPGVPIAGEYAGKLDNAGEVLVIRDEDGNETARVAYDDDGMWPLAADGLGFSLVPLDPGKHDLLGPEAWRASAQVGGSPGRRDPLPPFGGGRAVVNEVLANPSPVQDFAVELHNPSAVAVDIGGWFVSDRRDDPGRYRIPSGTVLPARGYVALYGADLLAAGVRMVPSGGSIFVASAHRDGRLTGLFVGMAYEPADAGRSSGRAVTSAGTTISVLERPTFGVDGPADPADFRRGTGAPNAEPYVGPVVLNEVMYHPAGDDYEYLEILNRSPDTVPLHAPGNAERTWAIEGGVRFAFPPGFSLPPGGIAVVAPVDALSFRDRVPVPADVPVLGPFDGRLDNSGESVRVVKPWPENGPLDGTVTAVDSVRYAPAFPWPRAADGTGPSLERLDARDYGSDPANWSALKPGGTPGRANTVPRAIYLPLLLSDR